MGGAVVSRWPDRTVAERFWEKVDATGICWEWTGSRSTKGYGQFNVGGGHRARAHRFVFELLGLPVVPDELTVDHVCRNTRCVNPDHLEIVPGGVNTLRGGAMSARYARRSHCINGHEYTDTNTRFWGSGRERYCLACQAERREQRRARLREAS